MFGSSPSTPPATHAEAERRRRARIDADEAARRAARAEKKRLDGLRLGPFVCEAAPSGPTVAKVLGRKGRGLARSIAVRGCAGCGGDHDRVEIVVGWRRPRDRADTERNVAAGWSPASAAPPPEAPADDEPEPAAKPPRATPKLAAAKVAIIARLEGGAEVPSRELREAAGCGARTFWRALAELPEVERVGRGPSIAYRLRRDDAPAESQFRAG